MEAKKATQSAPRKTGVQIVTHENVKTPEMVQLLEPPVAKYLK